MKKLLSLFRKKTKQEPRSPLLEDKPLRRFMGKTILTLFLPLLDTAMGMSRKGRKEFFRTFGQKVRESVAETETDIDDKVLDELIKHDLPAFLEGMQNNKT
tara:strand:+ start:278 stop:580 length:303 start_codon:yes stop_codon:yes gene_type:complete